MIYEMRIYSCVPGKMPAVLDRFENTTLALWEKHGIRQAGFWTTMIGPSINRLTYMLAWESLGERQEKWTAFTSDPAWKAAAAASEADGPLLTDVATSFLAPTRFSSVFTADHASGARTPQIG